MKKYILMLIMSSLLPITQLPAQSFTLIDQQQGFLHQDDTTWFLFDPAYYKQKKVSRVVVTGSFRGWSQNLNDPYWNLQLTDEGIWVVAIPNEDFVAIQPRSEFKFLINDGDWQSPPADTLNARNGNLIFLKDVVPATLKAELRGPKAIWAKVYGTDRPLDREAYRLTRADGSVIPIAEVLPNTATETLVVPETPLDMGRVYYLEIPQQYLRSICSFDGWYREIYSDKALGANISEDGTHTWFRIFSVRATGIQLYLYRGHDDEVAYQTLEMVRDEQGVWEARVEGNLKGVYYDFTVHGPDEPGSHFYETTPVHISDPYARVNVDAWGKSRVWEKTIPATPLKKGIPPMEDVIAYEVHVQDFTDLLPVPEALKGTIPAMGMPGLKNSKGHPIGFDYLVDLGINVVHLMPVQQYLRYKDDDWRASFEHDPFMIRHGINMENYQWGYRTSHCFAVESRYRQKGTEYGAERDQFRDLVQGFHDKGIAVIIDIVPNHTAENMDGKNNPYFFHFNVLDKAYYYRTDDKLEHIGEYGNEVKTENRPMVQRWLIDQCKHFIEEFGIDGFRIDLAGQIDQQTLRKLKKELGEEIIVYGEPWIGSNDAEFENNPDWDWYKADSPITFFQDDARNAFKGPVSNPYDKWKDRGYAGGLASERDKVMQGLSNTFPEDYTPLSGINYLDIHDNWTLADQFAKENWDGRFGVDEDRFKIAATLLYTSLGPIVTNGGTEMMRSKGLGELKETVKETLGGTLVYLHGKRDTYNMRAPNQFIWENLGKSLKDPDCHCDYTGMYRFWRGLNQFRLSEYGQVFRQSDRVPEGYYQWIAPEMKHLLGYIVDNQVMVMINTGEHAHTFNQVMIPAGNWKLIGNNTGIDPVKGVKDGPAFRQLRGGHTRDIVMPPVSLKIWVRESSLK